MEKSRLYTRDRNSINSCIVNGLHVCVCVCVRARACVGARTRVGARVCVCACARTFTGLAHRLILRNENDVLTSESVCVLKDFFTLPGFETKDF
jgi:hypothetical protein